MDIGKGIATAGIWIGVAIATATGGAPEVALISIPAMIATVFLWVFG